MPAHAEHDVTDSSHFYGNGYQNHQIQRMTSLSSSEEEVPVDVRKPHQLLATAIRTFALNLLKLSSEYGGQLVACPFSVATTLAVLDLGSFGATAEQFRQLLHLPDRRKKGKKGGKENRKDGPKSRLLRKLHSFSSMDELNVEEFHEEFQNLLEHFSKSTAIDVCTGIFPPKHKHTCLSKTYKRAVKEMFQASIEKFDFEDDAQDAVDEINRWVSERTRGRITEVISKSSVDAESSILLINAIYFSGKWNIKFDPTASHPRDFHLPDGSVKQVTFMTKKAEFGYHEDEKLGCKCLQLNCAKGEFAYYVILPNEIGGLRELEDKMDADNLEQLTNSCQSKTVMVYLPKYKMEQNMALKKPLSDMGVKDLFQAGVADLSGIDNRGNLYVSEMMHKVYFNVDEEGAEGAAVTTAIVKAAGGPRPPLTKFEANHPFIFMIKEEKTGIIAFIGRFCGNT